MPRDTDRSECRPAVCLLAQPELMLVAVLPKDLRHQLFKRSGDFLARKTGFVIISDVDYSKIIRIEPGKRSGKPTIRGTRMTVTDVLEYLAGGMSEEEILAEFPDLTTEDIKACLAFAADRERKLATLPEHETAV